MSYPPPSTSDSEASHQTANLSPPTSPGASSVQSLPSSSASSSILESIEESDAEREWKESLKQLELLLTTVLVPYAGKYFGRRAAYWVWAKYMEWNYPVEVVISSPRAFKGAGAVEAAASL